MAKPKAGKAGKGASPVALLKWPAWALALLAVGSAFGPLPRDFLRGLHWALCLFAILEAGVALGTGRRNAFFVYAAAAVLVNPFRPFAFSPQVWRLLHAGIGLWFAADQVQRRK